LIDLLVLHLKTSKILVQKNTLQLNSKDKIFIKNKISFHLSGFCFLYFICLRYYPVVASLQIIISWYK